MKLNHGNILFLRDLGLFDTAGDSGYFADVIVPLALPKNFTWSVPVEMIEKLRPGIRVEVELGKSKRYAGVVKRIHKNKPELFETKPILNLLDVEPVLFEEQLNLWEWIADYYLCGEGEVMASALPSHFKLSSESVLVYNEEAGDDFSALDAEEYLVAEALLIKKELKLSEVQQILDLSHVYPVIKRLIDKRICQVWETLKESYVPKKETYVTLNPVLDNEESLSKLFGELERAPKQLDLLLSYLHYSKTAGEVTKAALLKKSNASDSQLKGLTEKKILLVEKRHIDRMAYLPKNVKIDFELSDAQEKALHELKTNFETKQVCLLHGVTSSGKTQVYVKMMEEMIKTGKQVLFLLPEIALTSQIIRRLQKHFGGYIGIYHSKFNSNERFEIWNKVKSGELRIVLGARSALFLPFSDLGLVIVDEEHDTSFKQQDMAPRYNARDAAIYYSSQFGAKVLLGSATPSLETFYNAQTGKYGLVSISERFGGMEMPEIQLIDLKKISNANKEKTILTPDMKLAIENALENNSQIILFQNRRGYSPYQICETCGWIPQCKHCDVSLNFHKNTHKLHCHYCGATYPPVHRCQACGTDRFSQRNFGTEKIEEQLEELFPKAKIARMDVDSVKGKQAHDLLIQQFEQKRIDILVGTQMVVKGLDFENVSLVGILDADSILSFADFRVNERAFQLMEQVSGRAGRKGNRGRVLVQVSNLSHPVLQFVRKHDFPSFFNFEMEGRKNFNYPPFSRFIRLTFKHHQKNTAEGAAQFFTQHLKSQFGRFAVGPAEPVVNRIRNQFLMELNLKLPRDASLIKNCKQQLLALVAQLHFEKRYRSVVVVIDVDAY